MAIWVHLPGWVPNNYLQTFPHLQHSFEKVRFGQVFGKYRSRQTYCGHPARSSNTVFGPRLLTTHNMDATRMVLPPLKAFRLWGSDMLTLRSFLKIIQGVELNFKHENILLDWAIWVYLPGGPSNDHLKIFRPV